MGYEVIRQGLDELRAEWRVLLGGGRAGRLFQHPAWQELWLEEFGEGGEAYFLTVRDDAALLGVAPLFKSNDIFSFIGDPDICDYMDFVLAPGHEEKVLSVLLYALYEEDWSQIDFRGLKAGSPTLQHLPSLAARLRFRVEVEKEAVCPQLDLPATWEGYLALLDKKHRHELRRKLRRLERVAPGARLVAFRRPAEVAAGMDDFLRLMRMKSDKARFMTPQMERFFRRAAEALAGEGLVALYALEVEARRVAAALCFEDAQELLVYNSGYDPAFASLAAGLISKALIVRSAIEKGRAHFDFLRGAEPYKYDLGGKDVEVYRCLIERP
ncbi:MAG: GNAT family N-acetyltransferase [Dehalococcoidia bacterium]|nr:GNAT family N-acetyltransferase [Dehalococcoidia bacterium]